MRYSKSRMRRAIGSSFLIVLLNCTLMFGGCVSCPQFFMMPGATDCCKAGKCERSNNAPVKRDCQRMPLAHSGEQVVHIGLALIPAALPSLEPARLIRADAPPLDTVALAHSPPDLTILNSTFLI